MTHVLIVISPYYQDISDALLQGAEETLTQHESTYDVISVPGAFEIPAAIRFALFDKKYDGFVALGCVIRGETSHYDYVCGESARGITELALKHGAAIGYGILTVENEEQATQRADTRQGNKGGEAALAALRLIEIKRQFNVTL